MTPPAQGGNGGGARVRAPGLRAVETMATIAYPLGVHAGVVLNHLDAALLVVSITSGLLMLLAIGGRNRAGAALFALLLAFGAGGLALGHAEALYLPPLAVILSLWVLFARTLMPGREPIITRVAGALGDRGAAVERYTRAVTWVWVGFFALLFVESLLLALFAPIAIWSLFTNFLNYLFAGLLFVIEYLVRRRVLPNRSATGWQALLRTDWSHLLGR